MKSIMVFNSIECKTYKFNRIVMPINKMNGPALVGLI